MSAYGISHPMPRKALDEDFEIYVDPSCLSTVNSQTMDDNGMSEEILAAEEAQAAARGEPDGDELQDEKDAAASEGEVQQSSAADEVSDKADEASDAKSFDAGDILEAASAVGETSYKDAATAEMLHGGADKDVAEHLSAADESFNSEVKGRFEHKNVYANDQDLLDQADDTLDGQDGSGREHNLEAVQHDDVSTNRSSDISVGREAAAQAVNRAVVRLMEERKSREAGDIRESIERDGNRDNGTDISVVSARSRGTNDVHCRRNPAGSRPASVSSQHTLDGGDSSSHRDEDDREDDVFSSRGSLAHSRSSLGSVDSHGSKPAGTVITGGHSCHSRDGSHEPSELCPAAYDTIRPSKSRASHRTISTISGLSQYDHDEANYSRCRPRIPFHSQSSPFGTMLPSSPTPSIRAQASPSKRHSGLPTISRLGSPSDLSSPRRTPTRLKMPRTEPAPLVLLHVTLLPIRWPWGDVLDEMDAVAPVRGSSISWGSEGGNPSAFEPSEALRNLRGAWRQLQDRLGDTEYERGVLLPHPQGDFEVLEERLLEALELPLRRRARILECGHYLGPSNEMETSSDYESDSSDGEAEPVKQAEERHWCGTCKGDIRFESLGPGKVFRVKVYASNGLLRAGAWAACWKEMERVDVELEPMVDEEVAGELELLTKAVEEEEEARREREQKERKELEEAEKRDRELQTRREEEDRDRKMNEERIREAEKQAQRDEEERQLQEAFEASERERERKLRDERAEREAAEEQRLREEREAVEKRLQEEFEEAERERERLLGQECEEETRKAEEEERWEGEKLEDVERQTREKDERRKQDECWQQEEQERGETELRVGIGETSEVVPRSIEEIDQPPAAIESARLAQPESRPQLPSASSSPARASVQRSASPASTRPEPAVRPDVDLDIDPCLSYPRQRITPRSPSEAAYQRVREQQNPFVGVPMTAAPPLVPEPKAQLYQTAGLGELLFEAGKVLFRDPKNVAIAVLAVVLAVVVLGGPAAKVPPRVVSEAYGNVPVVEPAASYAQPQVQRAGVVEAPVQGAQVVVPQHVEGGKLVPCDALGEQQDYNGHQWPQHLSTHEHDAQPQGKQVVRVFETVTETIEVMHATMVAVAQERERETMTQKAIEPWTETYSETATLADEIKAETTVKGTERRSTL